MKPVNRMNPAQVDYFSLKEYVDNIRINDDVLYHLEDTNREFDRYLSYIAQFDDYSVIHYWIDSLFKEMKSSQQIENHLINPVDMLENNVFFDSFQMSHTRIKKLHQFVVEANEIEDYRVSAREVRVSAIDKFTGDEIIYWRGAQGKDVKRFMDDFISIYKSNSLSLLNSNPFLKSALVSLLFIRIHPFIDGNGRTSRMIYNIKFTDAINKIYNTKLKLCPLNISHVILMYKSTYVQKIDEIYFDLEHDCNDEINAWFNFILNRADDAIFYNMNRISSLEDSFRNMKVMKAIDTKINLDELSRMNLQKVKK